ncbi:MAG: sodium:proton antiporter [Planctomycetes bacterium]|nr:sodium:proton antiporter [Planctomycetota bacterium]MBU1518889.1 sodium:proton antiporter [Planctomycetota bacterium]MBU2457079.1 sodium:proton antiporter [Planctomycetota bacterium]MBU2596329.1 sodium:proton antiporter [Planctomycetota bacterium]
MLYSLCFLLFMIGLYCVLVKKNMIKIVVGILLMEYAVNLFLVMLGWRKVADGAVAPIAAGGDLLDKAGTVSQLFVSRAVDPLPQALVLTSIVIGLGSLALMVAICIRTYEKYGTFDITRIRRLKG